MSRLLKIIIAMLILISVYFAVKYLSHRAFIGQERFAKITQQDVFDDKTNKVVYLEQNWSENDSVWFYNTTQGSTWMPYRIFIHLEQAENETRFLDDQNINRYRYLVQTRSETNPDGLPVGFVKTHYQDKDYVGFTCAACHTAQLDYNGVGIRIDGAPALADMDSMLRDVEKSLKASLENTDKFERLANKVLDTIDADSKAKFWTLLNKLYEEKKRYNYQNTPHNGNQRIDYGFARLDAFGRIYNRVLSHITPNDPENFNPPNAPVSYPFLWGTPHSDFVQWNGIGNNHGEGLPGLLGTLARNTGEILGVFSHFSITKNSDGNLHYETSADRHNLQLLERHLQSLRSPQWPETILPPIDKLLAQQGKAVYEEYQCARCHSSDTDVLTQNPAFKRDDDSRLMVAQFVTLPWIKTDPQMVENVIAYEGKSGIYQGESMVHDETEYFSEKTPTLLALSKLIEGIIFYPEQDDLEWESFLEKNYLLLTEWLYLKVPVTLRHNDFEHVTEKNAEMLNAYKARTLNGIWATAPYLHNGSVPNLYELFLPACSSDSNPTNLACRSQNFTLGSRSFDADKVGFVSKKQEKYPTLFEFDTTKPGNSNKGHEYAAGVTPLIKLNEKGKAVRNKAGQLESYTLPPISDAKREALVEYLKTL